MMNKKELKKKLDEAGLGHVSNELLMLAKMSIRFTTTKSNDTEMPVGASKIGGYPDLPPNYPFPKWKEVPLAFLAQINLADISDFNAASELPSSGLLSFFYSATQETWGYDPADIGSWRVCYFDNLNTLQRVEPPNDFPEEGHYLPCSLSFFEELTIPTWDSALIERLNFTDNEMNAYIDLPTNSDDNLINRILGYPNSIQGDMQLECQLVSNGLYCGDETGYKDPRRIELEPDSINWKLLFQLDSEEENAHMFWGDVGRVYFWINKTALSNRDFNKAWFQLQCY